MKNTWRLWFRKLVTSRTKRSKGRRTYRPTIEVFEERTLLSAATHLAIVGYPNPAPIGTAFNFTVEALDSSNSLDPSYNGTVHIASTDSQAVLPGNASLTAGLGIFSATLETAGNQTLTATGTGSSAIPSFAPAPGSPVAVVASPRNLVGADFNGDGKPDLAVGGPNSGNGTLILLGNGNGTFKSAGAIAQGSRTYGMLTADFNGDGKPDIALADYGSDTIHILLGNGNGTFGPELTYPAAGGTNDLEAGDFNNDGKMDLAVTNASSQTVLIFLGNGNGTFQPSTAYALGDPPIGIAVGDFNNDGKQDLAIATANIGSVHVLLGNGNGTFQGAKLYACGPDPAQVVAGDFNGDGKPDLAVENRFDRSVTILLGNGDGSFQAPVSYAVGGNPYAMSAVDVNGDGKPDLVTGNANSNSLSVLVNNGNGTFASPQNISVGGFPLSIVGGDFNGDGSNDLAVVNQSTNNMAVFLNQPLTGSATIQLSPAAATHFTVTAPIAASVGQPANVTVIAFDQFNNVATGYTGTVIFTSSDNQGVLPANATLNSGVGTFSVTLKTTGNQTLTATDAVTSSLSGFSNAIAVTVLSQPATHLAIVGFPNPTPIGAAFRFTVEALDAQNNVASGYNGTVHFTSGDSHAVLSAGGPLAGGIGTFSATLGTLGNQSLSVVGPTYSNNVTFGPGPGAPSGLSAATGSLVGGNFRNNGIFDLVGSSAYYSNVTAYLNSGNGTFTAGATYPTSFDVQPLVVGDFNGDGKLDLAMPVGNSNLINVLLGNGNGTFGPTANYLVGNQPTAIAVGDFNGDGKQDLAVINYNDGTLSVLLANPNAAFGGTFGVATNYPVGHGPKAVVAADFNNDGKLDLLVTNANDNDVELFLGNGNGAFGPGVTFAAGIAPATSINPSQIAAADFNGDGNMDVAVPSPSTNSVSVLLGNGNGTFRKFTTYPAGLNPDLAVAVDLNGDGKPDVIVTDVNNNTLCVLLGNGDGTFATAQFTSTHTYGSSNLAIGDMNGDGTPDVAFVVSGGLYVLLNQPLTGSATVPVSPGPATHFTESTPSTAAAGKSTTVTVTAFDAFNDVATGYAGTVNFTSSDPAAVLPASGILTSGIGIFSLTFQTQGSQTLTVSDSLKSSITGSSGSVTVSGAATHFIVSNRTSTTAGNSFSFTVTAQDSSGNTAAGYGGTVHFTSSDGQAVLPGNATLAAGVGIFTVTLKTAGTQTVTAADTATTSISGSTTPITVSPGVAAHFTLSGSPSSATAGIPISFTVTAQDAFNNTATGYGGSVHFAVNDSQAVLPANAPLISGSGLFTATLKTAGSKTITASDTVNGTLTGISTPIVVSPAAASHFAVAVPSSVTVGSQLVFTITALDPFNNIATGYLGTVQFTSSDSQAVLPANATLINGTGSFGATLKTLGNQTLTATDAATSSVSGSSNAITVIGLPATHFAIVGYPNPAPIGTAFSFTVEALDSFNNLSRGYDGTVHFSSGDNHAVLPANGLLTSGIGTFSATLGTLGSQSLSVLGPTYNSNPTFVSAPGSPFTNLYGATNAFGGGYLGDGNFDLLGISGYYSKLTVYINAGNGAFTQGPSYPIAGSDPWAIVEGDFNGDGKLDVATSGQGGNTITVLLGNGNGTFGPTASYQVGNRPIGLAGGDFNGDGKEDLAVINTQDDTLSILLANPNGGFGATFGPAANYPLGNAPTAVAVGDFNNDGKLDLVVTNTNDNDVEVFLGNGNGTFRPGVTFAAGTAPSQVEVGYFGNNGSADLVVNNPTVNALTVLLGNGNGTFGNPTSYAAGLNPNYPAVVDLNGDGKPDLLVADSSGNAMAVLLGKGDGTFGPAQFTSVPTDGNSQPVVGDLNGDGIPDVAFTGANALNVLINQPLTGTVTVPVGPAAATHFTVTAPSAAAAGKPTSVTVTAFDAFNDTATGYTGTVNFTSSDPAAVLPAGGKLTNGVGAFSLTFQTQGSQTLTVSDSVTSSITGVSGPVPVSGAATHLVLNSRASAAAGTSFTVTVIAEDSNNLTAAGYSGTVVFTSSDGQAVLPASAPLSAGVGIFTFTLKTVGNQTLTAADSVTGSITGSSAAIAVSPGAATHFVLIGVPASATAGASFSFTVSALDSFNNLASGYSGSVHFTSTDSQAALPANGKLTGGIGVFTATLKTEGTQSLTAADSVTSTISGISGPIAVGAAAASHFVVGAPSTATAGSPFVYTVTALDPFNNIASSYAGTVHFTSSDSKAILPVDTLLQNGVGAFGAAFKAVATDTLIATDTVTSTITGSSAITVSGAAVTHFGLSAPASTGQGNPIVFTVTALDPFNNVASSYSGTVTFTSSDGAALLGAPGKLTSGIGTFAAILMTAGTQTITATDSVSTSIIGTCSVSVVGANAQATHFALGTPSVAVVGSASNVTVAAEDQFNNVATSYTGIVHFTKSDSAGVVPPDYTFMSSDHGVHVFASGVTFNTTGNQSLTATDTAATSITGSAAVIVNTLHFSVSAPSSATAGSPVSFIVTALDASNNTATAYSGTVAFTTSDSQALLSAPTATLTNGVGAFAVTFKTAGNQTITAVDTTTASFTGASNVILVSPAPPNHLAVMSLATSYSSGGPGPSTFAVTGEPLCFTVIAQDSFNNLIPGYAGTVHFSSSDTASGVVLPPSGTLMSGMGIFSATLATPGTQVLMAADTSDGLTGTSNPIVTRGLVVTSFSPTPSGFTLTFDKPVDASTVNLYTAGSLPDDVILATAGSQVSVHGSVLFDSTGTSLTFVKTATATSLGSFNPSSGLLAAGIYTVTLRSFGPQGSGFQDALGSPLDGMDNGTAGNFQVKFTVAAPSVAVGIPDFARGPSNTDAIFFSSALTNGSIFALSYSNPTANPTTGTATITFSSTAAILVSNIQSALTSGGLATQIGTNASAGNTSNSVVIVTNDTSTGANVLVTFQSALVQATTQLLVSTTPGVSISPATINVSNNIPGMGIPIALSSGLGVTSGLFTLQYNPNLLTITGAVSKIAGASFTLVSNDTVAGTAVLSFSSPTRISSTATAITLGSLLASVPMSATASYGAKQLLHFSSEQLGGTAGPIAVTNQDGVEVAAYFGDVTDSGGPLTLQDATAIAAAAATVSNTAAQTIPGFSAFANLDPVIIGDVSLQGNVNSTDAGAITQEIGGTSRPTIPYAPIGLGVTPLGPSPAQSKPDLAAPLGITTTKHATIRTTSAQASIIIPFPVSAEQPTPAQPPEAYQPLAANGSVLPVALPGQTFGEGDQPALLAQDSHFLEQIDGDLTGVDSYLADDAAKRGHSRR